MFVRSPTPQRLCTYFLPRSPFTNNYTPMKKEVFRVVLQGPNGEFKIRDYHSAEEIGKRHLQIGVDDCSNDLSVRGCPVFRGLIGPMPETDNIVRYESPEVFEVLTKEWSTPKKKRGRKKSA